MRYETEGMAALRVILEAEGESEESIDTFKRCLVFLERRGFFLIAEEQS